MRPLTRPVLVLAIAVAVVALPTAASGAFSGTAAPNRVAANSTSYQDSAGENPAAPDITTLTVSNNDAGVVSFKVDIPNRPTLTQDLLLLVFVDTDANPQTGDPDSLGADYVIQIFGGEAALFRWDGADFTSGRRPTGDVADLLVPGRCDGHDQRCRARQHQTPRLRRHRGLRHRHRPGDRRSRLHERRERRRTGRRCGAVRLRGEDHAADAGRQEVTVGKPTAGKPLTARLVAARSDTGAIVQNGRVTCVGRIGNARLRAQVQRVVAGAATCRWNIPPAAKGKRFRGSVSVVFEGLRATESFSSRIG